MSQTRKGSAGEAVVNVVVGFGINFAANWYLLPLFGFTALTLENNIIIGVLYTVISLARSFALRRVFNAIRWGNAS